MTYAEFITNYPEFSTVSESTFNRWLPIAVAKSAIFPPEARQLATELYLCFFLSQTAPRSAADVAKMKIEPEGYTVEYAGRSSSDKWAIQLSILAGNYGIIIDEFQTKTVARSGDRIDYFWHSF